MHAVSFAEGEGFAVFARFELAHPRAVAIGFKTMFPDLPERVAVDIALIVLAANGGTGRDRTVDEDRGYRYSG